ncbi:MAG: hypothetical protein HOL15_10120 [Nitrospinaceae bacterium]|jgi:hypothetical protein|nr:hypothetical protein [Nitrospinaceae bacterium]MBT5869073.1 hypothetical protein [Nitrospinaceae bacterium]MBT6346856.1 hypothetical protein [Nitrospina sp.]
MILGLDDIPGGTPLFAFFIWLALSGLFYLSSFLAVLNVLDDLTKNSLLKIPAMLSASVLSAGLMTVFHYKPYALGALITVTNFYRVRKTIQQAPEKWNGLKAKPALFYIASYAYIFATVALAVYFPTLDFSE